MTGYYCNALYNDSIIMENPLLILEKSTTYVEGNVVRWMCPVEKTMASLMTAARQFGLFGSVDGTE